MNNIEYIKCEFCDKSPGYGLNLTSLGLNVESLPISLKTCPDCNNQFTVTTQVFRNKDLED